MIGMEMFVLNGTILQKMISPTECQNQNIFITDENWWISLNKSGNTGGPLRKRSDFNQALSTLTVYIENLEDNNSGPCHTGSTSNGNRHGVLPPLGGNGVDPGGLLKNAKSQ